MHITGSITDANPGPALYALMAPALTTAGFTLVDTVTISTRTHKVWKSAAASNVQNLDWYLDVSYPTTGAGGVGLIAFEFYDPATDLAYRGPLGGGGMGTTIDAATGSRYGSTGSALETNWTPNGGQGNGSATISTSTFGYWFTVTPNAAIIMTSGQAETPMYAGFYEPDPLYSAKAGSLLYPLYSGRTWGFGSATGSGGITRIPPLTAFTGGASWNLSLEGWPVAGLNAYPAVPTPQPAYPFSAHRVELKTNYSSGARIARYGWLRDCYLVPSSGVVRGDTCTIAGAAYVLASTQSAAPYSSVAFKAV